MIDILTRGMSLHVDRAVNYETEMVAAVEAGAFIIASERRLKRDLRFVESLKLLLMWGTW